MLNRFAHLPEALKNFQAVPGGPRVSVDHPADIARLRYQGFSLRAISRELGISDRSVRRLAAA